MDGTLARSAHGLAAGSMLAVRDAGGWTVISERGPVWLTLEGYSQDKWLRAGERFVVPGHGLMIIETDRAQRIRLEPPPAGALGRFFARALGDARRVLRGIGEASVYSAERMGCRPSR